MTDRPIIFSAAMIRALLDGRKTMTRRTRYVKHGAGQQESVWVRARAGDRLWVRECFSYHDRGSGCWYWADGRVADYDSDRPHPSIHMPRWASRLTLVVTATKIERLQKITPEDVRAEGIDSGHWEHFAKLWDSLHGAGGWAANPDVVALTFTVQRVNIDQMRQEAA